MRATWPSPVIARRARAVRSVAATAVAVIAVSAAWPAAPVGAIREASAGGAGAITAPAGIRVDVWAQVPSPTAFAVDARGRLWATSSGRSPTTPGAVSVVTRPGRPPTQVLAGLTRPLGLVWRGSELFVSSFGRVDAYSGLHGFRFARHRTVLTGLPAGTGPAHQNDGLAVGPGGRLWLGIGSQCNACGPTQPLEATVVSFPPSGRGLRVEASGLRNPYGLAFIPRTNVLLGTENGRDDLGAGSPPDELNRIVRGGNYGFPDCWGQGGDPCAGTVAPIAQLPPHASADGIAIVRDDWGPRYTTSAFVAEFGATGRAGTGHDVVRIPLRRRPDGTWTARAPRVFATGLTNPLAVAVSPRGLFVGDWTTGTVYRFRPAAEPR